MQIKQGLVHMLLQIQSSLARFQSTSPILLVWLLQKVNKTHESHSSLIIRGHFNTTVIILLLKFSAGTDNDVPTYFLYSTVPPPCPTKATYWVFLSRFTTTLELTTNSVKDAIENHPQFSHMKESHYFIAQFNMMGLNIAPICNVTA